jgi:hypothetical protein
VDLKVQFGRTSTSAVDTDVRELVESALSLFRGRLGAAKIVVRQEYWAQAKINGFADGLRTSSQADQ